MPSYTDLPQSGHKGVSWIRSVSKWRAQIYVKGVVIWLGEFRDIEDAKRAYDEGVRKYRQ